MSSRLTQIPCPPNYHVDAPYADEFTNDMQHLGVNDHVPYSPYSDFQPFIPYPNQNAFPTFTPNIGHINPGNVYPYSYPAMQYPTQSEYASNQTSPMMPSSPYPPPLGAMWTSPPMSPNVGFSHPRQGAMMESHGQHGQGYYSTVPSTWAGIPQGSPAWSSRPPRNSIPTSTRSGTFNRMSWSGPSKPEERSRERKAYHPQPPANRSDWVMWVGNVPPNTTHEELWRYFNTSINSTAEEPWRGPSSIFLISRSSCAFVNLTSKADLDKAVMFFNGRSLRPWDARCPRLVCRIRRRDDDLRSGVGAQRGTGMHRDWIKQQPQQAPQSPDLDPSPAITPEACHTARSVAGSGDSAPKSTASYASTNSSFLTRYFPMRIFILKSANVGELEDSVKTGMWRTQRHNEPVLDQAFRTSQEVYLIFGANKTGEFFGYAKMAEHIDKEKAKKWSGGSKSSNKPQTIKEEETDNRTRGESEPTRPPYFLSASQSHIARTSPGELSPTDDYPFQTDGRANTDPTRVRPRADSGERAQTIGVLPKSLPVGQLLAHSDGHEAERQQAAGSSSRSGESGSDRVIRKDTALTPAEKHDNPTDLADEEGSPFRIEWLKVGRLPFNNTKHLRNPWNADREVKVSRDGTEVEPGVAMQLMGLWDRYPAV